MKTVPRFVKVGCALGFLGGLASIFCMAIFFKADNNTLVNMGAYLLIAVMFFALAGGLSKSGLWSWNLLLLMTFLTIAAVCCAVVFSAVDIYPGAIMVIIAGFIIASLVAPSSRIWSNRMRV